MIPMTYISSVCIHYISTYVTMEQPSYQNMTKIWNGQWCIKWSTSLKCLRTYLKDIYDSVFKDL